MVENLEQIFSTAKKPAIPVKALELPEFTTIAKGPSDFLIPFSLF